MSHHRQAGGGRPGPPSFPYEDTNGRGRPRDLNVPAFLAMGSRKKNTRNGSWGIPTIHFLVKKKKAVYSLLRASMGLRRAAWTAGTAPKNRPTTKEKTTVAATMYQLMKMGTPETRDTM